MRYRYSNGAEVEAPAEKAESLRRVGFVPVEDKAPAKRAASRKQSAPADDE